jgi:hypothetical protein
VPEPAPAEDVWWTGLRWSHALLMQAARFEEAFFEYQRALSDARMRALLAVDESPNAASWREYYEGAHLADRPLRVPSWALDMQVATELDFLLLTIRNVLRAEARSPDATRTAMADSDLLQVLRNVAEHFDEVGGWSQGTLARDWPDAAPGLVAFTNKEIWIGGASGVPLSRVEAWAARVANVLSEALGGAATTAQANPLGSRVEGDDELPWPAGRLWYGWWLPTIEETAWPTTEAPTEVADAMGVMFALRRRRDPRD